MTCFSDRLVSANKLIVAAAAIYAAAVTFAHAASHAAPAHTNLPACSAKFVDDWNSWVPVNKGDKRPFSMPAAPCVMDDPSSGISICASKDCGGIYDVLKTAHGDMKEEVRIVAYVLPACSNDFVRMFDLDPKWASGHLAKAKSCITPTSKNLLYVCNTEEGCTEIIGWIKKHYDETPQENYPAATDGS